MREGAGHEPRERENPTSDRVATVVGGRQRERSASRPTGVFSQVHQVIGQRVRLGRDPENDVVIDDLLVSRFHAELRARQDGLHELVDLGSRNGTFVNGRAADRAIVHELDIVGVGHHTFRLVGLNLEEYVDKGSISFAAVGLLVRQADGHVLLRDVTFSLEERAFLAVIGPSGSGKTTLLNALTGFRPATEGRVLYDGEDLYEGYDVLRSRIGYVPQEDVLHGVLTVRQALDYGAQLRFPPDVDRATRTEQIDEVLESLGIGGVRDLPVHRLSGGQRRRVAVAMELVTKPSLLFLDEPTSGLDPGNERGLMIMLRGLADQGHTVIVVTHAMESIRLCDRIALLAPGGRLAYFGPPQLAPAAFECDDLQEVFQLLNREPDREWTVGAAAEPHPIDGSETITPEEAPPAPSAAKAGLRGLIAGVSRWGSQFAVLVRRQVRVLLADRRTAVLMIAQPLVLGVLILAALPGGQLSAPPAGQVRAVSEAGLVLLVVVLAATWIGAANAIGEIVRERPIIQRERAAGLGVFPYIASKVVVLGALTAAQCAVMATIALANQGSHDQGSLLASPVLELVIAAALAGICGMTLALLISSLSSTAEQATTVLPVILVLEMLLALGGLFPDVIDKPVLKQLSYAASTQWAFAASASSVDLSRTQAFNTVAREAPSLQLGAPLTRFQSLATKLQEPAAWQHAPGAWLEDVGLLVVIAGVPILATGLVVRRRAVEA